MNFQNIFVLHLPKAAKSFKWKKIKEKNLIIKKGISGSKLINQAFHKIGCLLAVTEIAKNKSQKN